MWLRLSGEERKRRLKEAIFGISRPGYMSRREFIGFRQRMRDERAKKSADAGKKKSAPMHAMHGKTSHTAQGYKGYSPAQKWMARGKLLIVLAVIGLILYAYLRIKGYVK